MTFHARKQPQAEDVSKTTSMFCIYNDPDTNLSDRKEGPPIVVLFLFKKKIFFTINQSYKTRT